jgi:eukaryotic-like serine/threonine-protein kinase
MLAAAKGEPCNQLPVHSAHRVLLERALHPNPLQRPTLLAVQAELGQWLAATGREPDGPVTEQLQRPSPAPGPPLPAPTWPSEERP